MNKVAIITPVYNAEKFIKEMIESVLNQSYKFIDLVLIDDHSEDNSKSICQGFSKKHENIHFIGLDKNVGPGFARNKGLDFVKNNLSCDFFTFIDADDTVSPKFIERMLNAALSSGNRIVISKITNAEYSDSENINIISSNELFKFRKQYCSFPGNGVGAKLFDSSLIDSFIFPKDRHEDLFIVPITILKEPRITLLDAALYFYRYRPESESHHESFHNSMLDRLVALRNNLGYVLNNDVDAKYHFYNEYFEYLNCLIFITKSNRPENKKLKIEKKNQLKEYKQSLISDIGKRNYYRYLLTERSIIYKVLSRLFF